MNTICAGATTEWPIVDLRLLRMDELTFGNMKITVKTNMADALRLMRPAINQLAN